MVHTGTSKMAAPTLREKSVTNIVYLIGFLDLLGVSMVMPLLSKHAKNLGATPTTIGILGSVYGGLQLFSSPLVGKWSDVAGRRLVLLWCLLVSASGYIMLGLSSGIVMLFLARIPTGLFKYSQEMSRTYLYDLLPKSQHSIVCGRFNAASQIGFIVGPIVGGHIADLQNGFHFVAMATTVIFVLTWVIVWMFLPYIPPNGQDKKEETQNGKVRSSSSEISLNPFAFLKDFKKIDWTNLWDIFLIRFLMGFAVMVYRTNFSLMVDYKFEISSKMTGYLISYSGVIGTISGFFVGRIASFYADDGKLLFHTGIVQMVAIAALTFSPSIWVLVISMTPLSLANSISRVCLTNLTIGRGHGQETGVLLGLGASVLSIGRMMSPTIGGIAQEMHVAGPGIVGTFFAFLGVCLMWIVPQHNRHPPHLKHQ